MGYSDYELEIYANVDADSDLKYNYAFPKKLQDMCLKRRAAKFTNEHDKNAYYRFYNKHHAMMKDIKIHEAKKFLEFMGYTVIERDK